MGLIVLRVELIREIPSRCCEINIVAVIDSVGFLCGHLSDCSKSFVHIHYRAQFACVEFIFTHYCLERRSIAMDKLVNVATSFTAREDDPKSGDQEPECLPELNSGNCHRHVNDIHLP